MILNRILRSLFKLGRTDIKILEEKNILNNEQYKLYFKQYKNLYHQDKKLQDTIYQMTSLLRCSDRPMVNPEKAVDYFLCELPFLLNTPSILEVPSSCFVYRNIIDLDNYLYSQKNLRVSNQGFMAVEFL